MLEIKTEEVEIDDTLKRRIEMICQLAHKKVIIYNGSIKHVVHTNLNYVEANRIIIDNEVYLIFNYSNDVYLKNLDKHLTFSEFEDYLKNK